jgi:hypothetical protein
MADRLNKQPRERAWIVVRGYELRIMPLMP